MRYLFFSLLIINIFSFAYFTFLHTPKPSKSFYEAEASLTNPIGFENNSADAPPLIGEK